MLVVIVIMVFEAGIVPEYLVVKRVGLMNTRWAVILYNAVNVYYLIILMRFFDEVPRDLITRRVWTGRVTERSSAMSCCRCSQSAIATLGLFYGVMHWNEYFRAGIYSTDPLEVSTAAHTPSVRRSRRHLRPHRSGTLFSYDEAARLSYAALRAGTIIVAIIPVLMLYPLILKYYTRGVSFGLLQKLSRTFDASGALRGI